MHANNALKYIKTCAR